MSISAEQLFCHPVATREDDLLVHCCAPGCTHLDQMRFIKYYLVFLSSGCATLELPRISSISGGSLEAAYNIQNPNPTPLSSQRCQ